MAAVTTTAPVEATVTLTLTLREAKSVSKALVETNHRNFRYEAGEVLVALGQGIREAEGRS